MARLQRSEAAQPDVDPTLLEAEWHPTMVQLLEALVLLQAHNLKLLALQLALQLALDEAAMLALRPPHNLALPLVASLSLQLKLLQSHEILPEKVLLLERQILPGTSTCRPLSTTLIIW